MSKERSLFKLSIVFTLSIFLIGSECRAQFMASTPISVTDGDDSFGKRSPKISINGNGEPVVFWMRTGSSEAFFMSTLTSTGFTAPLSIPFGTINPNLWSGSLGPSMASSGTHMYVTFEVYGDAIYTVHSADNGQTWDAPVAAFVPPQGRRATIPNIACDSDGHPYVAYVNTNASEGDAHYGLVHSQDYGTTFLEESFVNEAADGAEVCECCTGHIQVAPNGDVYVAFRNNDANLRDIWLARSSDGGATFASAFDMDETDWISGVCPSNGPHFIVDENQLVSAFFSGSSSWGTGAYLSSLDLNGDMVSATQAIPLSEETSSSQNYPRISGHGDTLAVVWQELNNSSLDIAMAISVSGSEGLLTGSIVINAEPGTQNYPQLIFHDGLFHVVYEDAISGTVMYQEVTPGSVGLLENEVAVLEVFPNPSQGTFRLSSPLNQSALMNVFDATGRSIHHERLSAGTAMLNLNNLGAGHYTLQVSTFEGSYQAQIIID
jgi:hypothetical protein